MIQLLLASMMAFAQTPPATTPDVNEAFNQCMEVCRAFADTPGFATRMCIDQCAPLAKEPKTAQQIQDEYNYARRCELEPMLCQ